MEKETVNTTCLSTECNTGCCGPEPIGCLVFILLTPLMYVIDIWITGPQAGFFNWFLRNFGSLVLTVIFCIILYYIYHAICVLINYIKTKIKNK